MVSRGYDLVAERYTEGAKRTRERDRYTRVVLEFLPPGALVLDLGCGAGIPTTRRLARRFRVMGVDVSGRGVELARGNVPGARFVRADMTALDVAPASFDAVTAFYSITHVPREEHAGLLRRIAAWLRPGGLLVAAMGAESVEGSVQEDWLGATMYFIQLPRRRDHQAAR